MDVSENLWKSLAISRPIDPYLFLAEKSYPIFTGHCPIGRGST